MPISGAAAELHEALSPTFANGAELLLEKWCEAICSGDLARIWEWVTDVEGRPGWQVLLDPKRCPAIALPWLAQFDGAVLLARMTEAEQRAAVSAPQAFGRGTVEQMVEVAKRGLTGSKTVIVEERYTGSAWRIRIKTLPGETPEPARLKAEIEAQSKPIGIVLFFNESNAITWKELRERTESNTWLKARTKYATWLALRTSE